jgi:hypothetical protein
MAFRLASWLSSRDVWIVPPRGAGRAGEAVSNVDVSKTTLRTYDPGIDAWPIQATDPVLQRDFPMIGRRLAAISCSSTTPKTVSCVLELCTDQAPILALAGRALPRQWRGLAPHQGSQRATRCRGPGGSLAWPLTRLKISKPPDRGPRLRMRSMHRPTVVPAEQGHRLFPAPDLKGPGLGRL